MSTYTTTVRSMIENYFDLGLKEYPIFDENYREGLNKKIINHYYFREIGFETASLFKFYLNRTMNEIMPYYNQLYKSELLKFNPFYNVDQVTVADRKASGTRTDTGRNQTDSEQENKNTVSENMIDSGKDTSLTNSSTSDNNYKKSNIDHGRKKVFSDTPQGLLRIGNIENEIYASTADIEEEGTHELGTNVSNGIENSTTTNLQDHKKQGTTTTNSELSGKNVSNSHTSSMHDDTDNYLNHIIGKSAGETYSEMLIKYRNTFLNIDMMVIDELKELFMNVY